MRCRSPAEHHPAKNHIIKLRTERKLSAMHNIVLYISLVCSLTTNGFMSRTNPVQKHACRQHFLQRLRRRGFADAHRPCDKNHCLCIFCTPLPGRPALGRVSGPTCPPCATALKWRAARFAASSIYYASCKFRCFWQNLANFPIRLSPHQKLPDLAGCFSCQAF